MSPCTTETYTVIQSLARRDARAIGSARGEQIASDSIGQRQPDIRTSLGKRYPGCGKVASDRSQDAIAARAILSLHLRNMVRKGRRICEILDDPLDQRRRAAFGFELDQPRDQGRVRDAPADAESRKIGRAPWKQQWCHDVLSPVVPLLFK